ncbi:cytochrome P450 4g15-like isoform X2 [Anopheles bellator]|uniref:cytochrome P450 4g15-like isoform X1 n=1 Tax=Anopheles bellator TaxID=139047 RepID=UPI002649E831|nr:cytochrome P450 4g15-like isoform X1 [Anopheles bellator]XP_058063437.1 cytochrome P450 4g15-like isoform X2 [Anopheles bellator]
MSFDTVPDVVTRAGSSWVLPVTVVAALSVVSVTLFHLWMQTRRYVKLGNLIPGPVAYPLIGNANLLLGKTHNQIMEKAMELSYIYGTVARGWIGYHLVVFLTEPADVEIILNSYVHLEKSSEYRFFKPWLGDGLLISSGDKWKHHRKLIAPTFHQNVLKTFVDVFNDNSRAVVERMRKEVGREFDCHDYMSEVTVDILLQTAMGSTRTGDNKEGFEYAMAVMKMCDILHKRQLKIHLRLDPLFNLTRVAKEQERLLQIIHGLTRKVVREKKALFERNAAEGRMPSPSLTEIIGKEEKPGEAAPAAPAFISQGSLLRDDLDELDENDIGEKRRLAFLDLMIETASTGANISDEEIKEEVDTIMFEGHDTTAAGSSFVLCLLGIHQDVQERVYAELQQIFGRSHRKATFADTLEMKYLERVIFESLRMFPPVPMIARKLNEDVRLASRDCTVPAGTTVVIGTYKIHHREDLYPEPERFNPDNFLPERTQNRHYYSYIPFSAGPRSCVGRKYAMLKLKVLLSTILRNYRVLSNVTEKDFKLQGDIILKRTDGFRVQLEQRAH